MSEVLGGLRAIGVAVGGLGAASVAGHLMVAARIEHAWLLNGSRVAEVDAGFGGAVGARSIT